jgi:hypothetical protein
MMGNSGMSGRPAGVGLPAGQLSQGEGSPRRVTNIARSEEFAVEYTDDNGQVHSEIMHRIGGVWHRAPNGENYARTLRRINPTSWLVKQIEERVADVTSSTPLPAQDAVDVLAPSAPSAAGSEG